MDDLVICKRIAEIEGVTVRDTGGDLIWTKCPKSALEPKYDDYNPLTDDALCFQLMVKYKLEVWEALGKWLVGFNLRNTVSDESANKAICLSIIEAHKDENDEI